MAVRGIESSSVASCEAEAVSSGVLSLQRQKPCVRRDTYVAVDDICQQLGMRSIRMNHQPIATIQVEEYRTTVASVVGRIREDRHSRRADILHLGFHSCAYITRFIAQ